MSLMQKGNKGCSQVIFLAKHTPNIIEIRTKYLSEIIAPSYMLSSSRLKTGAFAFLFFMLTKQSLIL